MFNSIKNDFLLSLLIGNQNSQIFGQNDQVATYKKRKWNRIGTYELAEDVEACLLLEYSVYSHKAVGSPDPEELLLCFIFPLSYKRLEVKET